MLKDLSGLVTGAIVDGNDFKVRIGLIEKRFNGIGNIFFRVVQRHSEINYGTW
jgi:hypothetical protein